MKLNEPQKQTFENLKKILPMAHFVDIRVRKDGEYKFYEADWLKEAVKELKVE